VVLVSQYNTVYIDNWKEIYGEILPSKYTCSLIQLEETLVLTDNDTTRQNSDNTYYDHTFSKNVNGIIKGDSLTVQRLFIIYENIDIFYFISKQKIFS